MSRWINEMVRVVFVQRVICPDVVYPSLKIFPTAFWNILYKTHLVIFLLYNDFLLSRYFPYTFFLYISILFYCSRFGLYGIIQSLLIRFSSLHGGNSHFLKEFWIPVNVKMQYAWQCINFRYHCLIFWEMESKLMSLDSCSIPSLFQTLCK